MRTKQILQVSAIVSLLAVSALAQAAKPPSGTKPTPGGKVTASGEKAGRAGNLEQEAIAREKELAAAEKRHDWEFISRALAHDFVEVAGDGKLYTKAEVAQYFPDVRVQEFSLDNFRVVQSRPDAVLLLYTANAQATFKGQPFPAHNYVSSYWVRRRGEWRMIFHQATPIPEEGSK